MSQSSTSGRAPSYSKRRKGPTTIKKVDVGLTLIAAKARKREKILAEVESANYSTPDDPPTFVDAAINAIGACNRVALEGECDNVNGRYHLPRRSKGKGILSKVYSPPFVVRLRHKNYGYNGYYCSSCCAAEHFTLQRYKSTQDLTEVIACQDDFLCLYVDPEQRPIWFRIDVFIGVSPPEARSQTFYINDLSQNAKIEYSKKTYYTDSSLDLWIDYDTAERSWQRWHDAKLEYRARLALQEELTSSLISPEVYNATNPQEEEDEEENRQDKLEAKRIDTELKKKELEIRALERQAKREELRKEKELATQKKKLLAQELARQKVVTKKPKGSRREPTSQSAPTVPPHQVITVFDFTKEEEDAMLKTIKKTQEEEEEQRRQEQEFITIESSSEEEEESDADIDEDEGETEVGFDITKLTGSPSEAELEILSQLELQENLESDSYEVLALIRRLQTVKQEMENLQQSVGRTVLVLPYTHAQLMTEEKRLTTEAQTIQTKWNEVVESTFLSYDIGKMVATDLSTKGLDKTIVEFGIAKSELFTNLSESHLKFDDHMAEARMSWTSLYQGSFYDLLPESKTAKMVEITQDMEQVLNHALRLITATIAFIDEILQLASVLKAALRHLNG